MLESSSMEMDDPWFKKCADMTLGDIMGCDEHRGGARLTAALNPKGLSQP